MSDRNMVVQRGVPMAASDGVQMLSDVYTPDGDGPFPVLLLRTPYGKTSAQSPAYRHPQWYAGHGYIVVVQDVRGRGVSGGEWYPFQHEAIDGRDAVEWSAMLPKSNGRVGMYGLSYAGACQLLAAGAQPPHLVCIAPAMTSSDYWDGWTYRGGALQQAFVQSWVIGQLATDTARRRGLSELYSRLRAAHLDLASIHEALPLRESALLRSNDIAPYYFDWLEHATRDDYWARWGLDQWYARMTLPALHIGGWYDIFVDGTVRNFLGIRGAAPPKTAAAQRLIIGPWYHVPWGRMVAGWDFGPEARNFLDDLQLRWFDHWLRNADNGVSEENAVRLFLTGADTWREYASWPPTSVGDIALFLDSDGAANSINGNGRLVLEAPDSNPDIFVYDPSSPVPSLGGRSCCAAGMTPMGPANQLPVEVLNSVLVYTSPALRRDLEAIGPVAVTLHASSTARDTDWTAKLVDLHHDGLAVNLADGILRARYRKSWTHPELIAPDECLEYRIDLGPIASVFKAGHRIRLEISSSNFPAYDRNLNTGGPLGGESLESGVVATQQVYHEEGRHSRLHLSLLQAPDFDE